MVFLDLNCPARTDISFRLKIYAQDHKGRSILDDIPGLDMVKSFPLDYMHLVLLGVVRKFIYAIRDRKTNLKVEKKWSNHFQQC